MGKKVSTIFGIKSTKGYPKWNGNKLPMKSKPLFSVRPSPMFKSINKEKIPRQPPLFKPIPMAPSNLFKKESIKQKRLSSWGDADMDGSPNMFDCDPRKVNKDGMVSDFLSSVGSKIKEGVGKTVRLAKLGTMTSEQRARTFAREDKIASLKATQQAVKKRTEQNMMREIDEINKFKRKEALVSSELSSAKKDYDKLQNKNSLSDSEQAKLQSLTKRLDTLRKQENRVGNKIERRQTGLEKIELKGRERLSKVSGKLSKTKQEYNVSDATARQAKGKRINRQVFSAVEIAIPGLVKQVRRAGLRGRPVGSVKYNIPGKGPVGVFEYRRWEAQQKKLKRLAGKGYTPQQIQEQLRSEQVRTYSQPVQRSPPRQMQTQQVETVPQEGYQQPIENYRKRPQQIQPTQYVSEEDMQMQEQANDNVLNAPNIQRGEMQRRMPMRQTPNILNAPNIMKGQMRRQARPTQVGTINEYGEVQMFDNESKLQEGPVGNPYGDEYLDINPATGEQIMRRRPREKWANNEAY